MPPTMITGSPWQSAWTSGSYPRLVPTGATTFAASVGDIIVVTAVVESQSAIGTPTNAAASPATITWTQRGVVTTASRCWAGVWTGAVTVAGNVQVSCAAPGAGIGTNAGYVVYAFSSHGGVGAVPAGAQSASGTPSLTTTWAAGSTVMCANGDFNAGSIAGLAYLANIGAATQVNASQVDTNYSTEAWYHADSGAGGSQAVGQSAPGAQTYSLVAVEVLSGTTASAVTARSFNAIPFMGGVL